MKHNLTAQRERIPLRELWEYVNWGEESFAREVQEWYGYYTMDDWVGEEKRLAYSHKLFLTHTEKYLQPGYKEHLRGKIILQSAPRLDWSGQVYSKPIDFPASNCLVVFERVC